jgi:hypothetical protein
LFIEIFRSPQSCKILFLTAIIVSIILSPVTLYVNRIQKIVAFYRLCVLLLGYT